MKKIYWGALGILFLLLTAYVGRQSIAAYIGSWTMREDHPTKVDAVMILNGAFPRSVLAAADLYHRGLTKKVIMTQEREWDGMDELRARKVSYPYLAALQKKSLLDLGVPDKNIVELTDVCDRTELEGIALKKYLADHSDVKHIAFATRRSHTVRGRKILRNILGYDVQISMLAYEKDPVRIETWTRDPWHLYEVSMEVLKLAWYYTVGIKHRS